ncbi:hypothetical protein HERIO_2384 [Hepatospora eriocheir]|uniref:Uncharacterized protein n=1 Tax=Hepatospora eriocheir TaxID=1081669 RepID=A0A1X0Q761_9MICR|nr:hypothetical protein HERIO_2384 [Hepatospora eriocheir]
MIYSIILSTVVIFCSDEFKLKEAIITSVPVKIVVKETCKNEELTETNFPPLKIDSQPKESSSNSDVDDKIVRSTSSCLSENEPDLNTSDQDTTKQEKQEFEVLNLPFEKLNLLAIESSVLNSDDFFSFNPSEFELVTLNQLDKENDENPDEPRLKKQKVDCDDNLFNPSEFELDTLNQLEKENDDNLDEPSTSKK